MQSKLKGALGQFLTCLQPWGIDYALIGGLSIGFWAEERVTKDIDLTISLASVRWIQFHELLKSNPDIVIDQICEEKGTDIPHLIRIHYRQSPIDLIVSLTDFQESLLQRAVTIPFQGHDLRVASPEDVIVAKLIADRLQDRADIVKVVRTLSDLDQDYILHWSKVWGIEERWLKIKDQS